MTETPPVLAVDVGGTKIAAGIVSGAAVSELARLATPSRPNVSDLVDAIVRAVSQVPETPGPIAVATAGVVRDGRLRALNETFDIPDWRSFQAPLQQALGRPVVLLNDAQAATWGEFRHGAAKGASSVVYLTISTGMGGGVVADGRLLQGHQGLAGSIGLIRLDPGDPASPTLESKVSGAGLSDRVSEILQSVTSSEQVLESRDPAVRSIVAEMARLVAGSIANLAAIIDPEIVVIGGGVGLAPGVVDMIRDAMERYPPLYRPAVSSAALGHDAGLVGCADWLLQRSHDDGTTPSAL